MITIIETSTSERNAETVELFNKIKPLLDNGHSFNSALKLIGYNHWTHSRGWYRDLVDYAKSKGYVRK